MSAERVLHCWAGWRDQWEVGSPEWAASWAEETDKTCMLERGHAGPHDFTPDDEIGVTFA